MPVAVVQPRCFWLANLEISFRISEDGAKSSFVEFNWCKWSLGSICSGSDEKKTFGFECSLMGSLSFDFALLKSRRTHMETRMINFKFECFFPEKEADWERAGIFNQNLGLQLHEALRRHKRQSLCRCKPATNCRFPLEDEVAFLALVIQNFIGPFRKC